MNCDPCQFEDTQEHARAFCQECNEFLCQQCFKSHRKFQAFRHHHVVQGDAVPRTREETKPKLALLLCDEHRINQVQFYCSRHAVVLCSLCKLAKHSSCECKPIEDVCEKEYQAKLHKVLKDIEKLKIEFEQLTSGGTRVIDSTIADIKSQRAKLTSTREEINDFFDELENDITNEEIKRSLYVNQLRETVAMYTDAISYIASLNEHIGQVLKSDDKVAIFAANSKLKRIHKEYTTVKNSLPLKPLTQESQAVLLKILAVKEMFDNINEKINIQTFEEATKENTAIKHAESKDQLTGEELSKSEINMNQNKESERGNYDDKSNGINDNFKNANLDEQNISHVSNSADSENEKLISSADSNASLPETNYQAMLFENIKLKNTVYKSINSEMNDTVCDVTGSLFLPDGSLILCDHNSNLILLDKEFRLLHQLHFDSSLWDVALIDQSHIVITLKYQKLLKYIRIEQGRLYEGKSINLNRKPWGIAVYMEKTLTTFHDNPGKGFIEVRDRHGIILRNITADKHGEELFDSPFYIAVNQQNGNIYVTDGRKNSLTCLTFEGKVLYKIKSEEFKWPRKVILDDQGNCLLCASLANKLILIKNIQKSPFTEEIHYKAIVRKCKRPQTVSIRWEDQTIIVGMNTTNLILVLQ